MRSTFQRARSYAYNPSNRGGHSAWTDSLNSSTEVFPEALTLSIGSDSGESPRTTRSIVISLIVAEKQVDGATQPGILTEFIVEEPMWFQ